MTLETIASRLASTVTGLIIVAGMGALIWVEERSKTPDTHRIYAFLAVAGVGLFMVFPDELLGIAQRGVAIYANYRSAKP